MDIWDSQELLKELEEKRDSLRIEGKRLTFDCFNLKCEGDRAHCSLGKSLGQDEDGSLSLTIVLKGITSKVCKNCEDFSPGEIVLNISEK